MRVLASLVFVLVCPVVLWGAIPPKVDMLLLQPPCGTTWFDTGLEGALAAKSYLAGINVVAAGDALEPDPLRPATLGDTPGDLMLMQHWVLWFNDYFGGIKVQGSRRLMNRIVIFHSCFQASGIDSDGRGTGNPFSPDRTLRNYESIFRHPNGPNSTYTFKGYSYLALEDIFAANPDTLFIYLTAPPLHTSDTTNTVAARARRFNNWLKGDWLTSYRSRNPRINNVAVFDWFDLLANANDDTVRPNALKVAFGGGPSGSSQLNSAGHLNSTQGFASDPGNFLDSAWDAFAKDILFFSQFGGGGGLSSDLVLRNPSSSNAIGCSVAFFGEDGTPMALSFEGIQGGTPVSTVSLQLNPLGGTELRTAPTAKLATGWAVVVATGELGGVVRFKIPGAGIAGVGESVPLPGLILPVRMEDGVRTGFALANPGGTAVDVLLTLHRLDGSVPANGVRQLSSIGPGAHLAQFVDELFPDLGALGFSGTLQVEVSGGKVVVTGLELGLDSGQFTTLPVIPLQQ